MRERLITSLFYVVAKLPWAVLSGLGVVVGHAMYLSNGREAKNVQANLKIAYPDLSAQERKMMTKQALIHSAKTFVEMPKIWLSPMQLSDRINPNGLPEKMYQLLSQKKGLVLAVPHHGNWEIVTSGVPQDVSITALYRPPRQAFIEPLMKKGRAIGGIKTVPTDRAGIKALYDTLKANDVVAILPDQVPRAAGAAAVSAPFFGRESSTMVLMSRLAAKHNSPVLFCWAERQADNRYVMRYFDAAAEVSDKDAQVAAIALNQAVERVIADQPVQYQWAYRRYTPVNDQQLNPYS